MTAVCCWCGCVLVTNADQTKHTSFTKEHLVPKSLARLRGDLNKKEHQEASVIIMPACRRCNSHRGNNLGPPPMARPEGMATSLWKQGMAPWITYQITKRHLFR